MAAGCVSQVCKWLQDAAGVFYSTFLKYNELQCRAFFSKWILSQVIKFKFQTIEGSACPGGHHEYWHIGIPEKHPGGSFWCFGMQAADPSDKAPSNSAILFSFLFVFPWGGLRPAVALELSHEVIEVSEVSEVLEALCINKYIYIYIYVYICAVCTVVVSIYVFWCDHYVPVQEGWLFTCEHIYIYGGWLSTFEHIYIYLPSIIPDTWPSLFPPRGGGDN